MHTMKMKCKSFLVRFHYNKTESHMGVLNNEVGKSRFQTTIFIAPNDSPWVFPQTIGPLECWAVPSLYIGSICIQVCVALFTGLFLNDHKQSPEHDEDNGQT